MSPPHSSPITPHNVRQSAMSEAEEVGHDYPRLGVRQITAETPTQWVRAVDQKGTSFPVTFVSRRASATKSSTTGPTPSMIAANHVIR